MDVCDYVTQPTKAVMLFSYTTMNAEYSVGIGCEEVFCTTYYCYNTV